MSNWRLSARERRDLHAFLRKLVETPSLPGEEGEAANLVMAEMRRLGFSNVWADEAGNVVGEIGSDSNEGPTC